MKKIICFILAFVLAFGAVPAEAMDFEKITEIKDDMLQQALYIIPEGFSDIDFLAPNTAYTEPETVTVEEASARLQDFIEKFEGKFFTADGNYCVSSGVHATSCENCLMSNVIASEWVENLVGMGTLNAALCPTQYSYKGTQGYSDGYQCFGFANFAHWYIFAQKNTDKVTSTLEATGPLTYETIKNALPGDVLRSNYYGGHSMIFISCDEEGFNVIDSNHTGNADGKSACIVKVHKVKYNSKYTVAITGVKNYERTAECEHEYSEEVTPPTCTEQGYTTYICTICGESYVDDYVPATGEHKYEDGVCIWCGRSKLGSDWLAPEFAEGDYSMVVLPDTQIMVTYHSKYYYNMMQWIADNKEELNIQAVMHMGDMVHNNNDTEWTVLKNGTDIINEAGIPWMPMMGNHDDSAWFNRYYDYETFGTNQSWFGGSYQEGKLDHTYWFVTAGGREYLILSLGWAPSWDVLDWAKGVVEERSDKNVIINCHAYMDKDGTLLNEGDSHCVSSYYPEYPNGDDVWNAFKEYENVVLAMGGHISSPDIYKTFVDKNGINRDVYSLLIDNQNEDTGSKLGMVAVLTFHENSDKVDVNWYSTRYDALYGEENQFEITVPHLCEHEFTVSEKEATCTEPGGKYYYCTVCSGSYTEGETEALGHDYTEVVTEPTCTEAGYTELICERCGSTDKKLIPHDITDEFVWNEGYVISAVNGNMTADKNWVASDYVDISGYEVIEIVTGDTVNANTTLGFAFYDANKKFISGVLHTDKTGNEYGILVHNQEVPENAVYIRTTWYSVNHEKYNGAEIHTFYCKGYDTEIPSLGHDYREVVTEPTCTEQGYTTHTCTICGESYVDDYVDATGHTFGEWYTVTEPTATEPGEERRDCENCDYYETKVIPAKGYELGDLNLDGKVDVMDAYFVRLVVAKLRKPTEQQILLGDVDLDGKITAIDANIIRKYIIGIITKIPVE